MSALCQKQTCARQNNASLKYLAFWQDYLAPDLVKAAVDGRLPHGMGVARLTDLPAEWSRQYQILGVPAQ